MTAKKNYSYGRDISVTARLYRVVLERDTIAHHQVMQSCTISARR